jgi:hypothetical protein
MIEDYTGIWLEKVKSYYLDEWCFHLPFTPKPITEMNSEELELLENSSWEFHNIPQEGLQFFICKKIK